MWPPILTRFEGVHLLFVRDPEKWSLCEKTNRTIQQWYKEYTRYIKYNDPQSAYALHILNNKHEYGTLTDTMKVFKHISNPTMLFPSKLLFIHSYHHHKHLFPKQHIHEVNLLYQTILDVYDTSLTHSNNISTTPRLVLPTTSLRLDVASNTRIMYVF